MTSSRNSRIFSRRPRLILVDDDPAVLSGLRRVINAAEPRWEVWTARSGAEALDIAQGELIDVVVSDLNMPTMDGFQLLRRFEQSHPETTRILHSSQSATLSHHLLSVLAHDAISKPATPEEVMVTLRAAVRAPHAFRHAGAC